MSLASEALPDLDTESTYDISRANKSTCSGSTSNWGEVSLGDEDKDEGDAGLRSALIALLAT